MRPKFVKKHKRNPKSNSESPAMSVGACSKILTFNELFSDPKHFHKNQKSFERLPLDWKLLVDDEVLFKRDFKFCKKLRKAS